MKLMKPKSYKEHRRYGGGDEEEITKTIFGEIFGILEFS